MNISNFSEFYNLIARCNLQNTSPFSIFKSHVDDYKAHCNCNNPDVRSNKKAQCVATYINLATGSISSYIAFVKSTVKTPAITFLNNGKVIKTY
jgi:hypothetical protein